MEFPDLKVGDAVSIITSVGRYGDRCIDHVDWVGRKWFTTRGKRIKFSLEDGYNNTDYSTPYAERVERLEERVQRVKVVAVFRTYGINVDQAVLTLEELEALSAHLPKAGEYRGTAGT